MWNQRIKLTALLLGSLILSGCASNAIPVSVTSNPQGARIYCNDAYRGNTPANITFMLTEDDIESIKKYSAFPPPPCYLEWKSGVKEEFPSMVSYSYSNYFFNNGIRLHATRPSNVAGLEIDREVEQQMVMRALEKEIAKQKLEQQARQASYSSGDGGVGAILNQMQRQSSQGIDMNYINSFGPKSLSFDPMGNPTGGPSVYGIDRLQDNIYQVRKVK